MRGTVADVLLVVAIAASVYVAMCMALLLAAQLASEFKRIEWPRYLYLAAALWVAWVIVR